jgi:hypothetical protein
MAQLQRPGAETREQRSLSRANSILNRETERRSTRAAQDSPWRTLGRLKQSPT